MKAWEYSDSQKARIKEVINEALEESFEINKVANTGIPFWMSILFILEKFNKGNYYGTLLIKILGTSVNDVKEADRTHKLLEHFHYLKL